MSQLLRSRHLVACGFLSACNPAVEPALPSGDGVLELSDRDWLIRASLAIRGLRPSVEDMTRLEADPTQAAGLIESYLYTPEFIDTIEDLHADLLLLRTDSIPQFPNFGPLRPYNVREIYEGFTNEPLDLVGHVVDEDRPYTDIVTSETTWTNEVGAILWGLPYDFAVGGTQETQWSDGRPLAGVLSSGKLWQRYESAGSNFHRGRANVIADKLLCEPFDTRDIVVEGGIDIADEIAVSNAVRTIPACVACHQGLDPLAGYLWGFKPVLRQNQVAHAYQASCDDDFHDITLPDLGPAFRTSDYCYPLRQFSPAEQDGWEVWGLRPPAYYAQPAEDLADVGRLVAEDPRFSRCAVKNFLSYLLSVERDHVPEATATRLQAVFEENGFSARELVRAIVLSAEFRSSGVASPTVYDPVARMRTIRPEQYANVIEDLTGFAWVAAPDPADCLTVDDSPDNRGINGDQCWEDVDLGRSDRYGYHAMSGGTDSYWVVRPTHGPSPIKVLVMERFAWNAAGFVVDADFALPAIDRRLLTAVEPATTDEVAIRRQLADLHLRILGLTLDAQDPQIDDALALYQAALAQGDSASSWKLVISAMLQDPRMMFY